MMPPLDRAIFFVDGLPAASIVAKATVLLALALIAVRAARRSRASIRHAILAAGFAAILALPVVAILAPSIRIPLAVAQPQPIIAPSQPLSDDAVSPAARKIAAARAVASAPARKHAVSLFEIVLSIWVLGAAIALAPVLIGLWEVRRLRRSALPWIRGRSLAALANDAGISRPAEMLLHESVAGAAGPMTCGIFRPAVVFPFEAEEWPANDLHRAIAHELEHIRRADWFTHCLARAVCAAYWFHPLAWIAWRKLTLEAERACDDAVLARSEATAYAEQLVALARRLSAASRPPLLAMASRSDLSARVTALLDARQRRGRPGLVALSVAVITALLLIVAISPLRLIAAAQDQPLTNDLAKAPGGKLAPQDRSASLSFEAVSIKPAAPPFNSFTRFTPSGFRAQAIIPKQMIVIAYGVKGFQISGLPHWAGSTPYDIETTTSETTAQTLAKLPRDQQITQIGRMLRSVLADRFNLKFHHQMIDGPVFALTLAKAGKIQPADRECTGPAPARAVPPRQGQWPAPSCQSFFYPGGHIAGLNMPISELIDDLSLQTNRIVLDQTGLAGNYKIVLDWTPDTPPDSTSGKVLVAPDSDSPSLQRALEDELGLKLTATRGPIDTFAIDHIEQPSPN